MSTTRTRWAGLLSAGALTLALGACSDDGGTAEGTSTPAGATTTEAEAAATETATSAPEVAEGEEIDPAIAERIEQRYLDTRHKRTAPVSLFDDWWI